MDKCKHEQTTFIGMYSMIGNYRCDSCKFEIDPIIQHARAGRPHVLFNEANREKLQEYLSKLPKEQLELLK